MRDVYQSLYQSCRNQAIRVAIVSLRSKEVMSTHIDYPEPINDIQKVDPKGLTRFKT